MENQETLSEVLKNRLGRCAVAVFGLMICAVGSYAQIQANYGLEPWSSLNQGISLNLPITYGTASIAVSALIILVDFFMKEPIGLGTILNALLMGVGIDLCIELNLIPLQTKLPNQIVTQLLGIVVMCTGQSVYMRAGFGCGPRDSLLVGLGKRFRKVSIGTVNLVMLAVVLIICLFLGSPIGLGTVIGVFGTGIIMDAVFHILRFDPKAVVHEDLPGTIVAVKNALLLKKIIFLLHKSKKICIIDRVTSKNPWTYGLET